MVFVACGLNHKTAPLDMREKFAVPEATCKDLLTQLVSHKTFQEGIVLSTCNRTEFYYVTTQINSLLPWLANKHQLPIETIKPYFYSHQGDHAIRHALRVASGLDSMMLGEPQIFGQLKQAYQLGCRLGTVKNKLQYAFQYIFSASKRIRTTSGIGNNPVSIASAGVQLITERFKDPKSLRVFLIGSGETATLVAKYLHKQGVRQFIVASRSQDNANRLMAKFGGKTIAINNIANHLHQADVIISATACPLPFINKTMVQEAKKLREQDPMFFLDLAVPRDIESDIVEIADVHLYNIDDLQHKISQGMQERQIAALHAEQLVESELDRYIKQDRSRLANGVICDYRSQMQELAQIELQRAIQKLAAGECQVNVLTEFSERLVNKLTHTPTVGLRQAARDERLELLDLAQYLLKGSVDYSNHEKIT
ncbi:MAG: glutamyl-tRNA reductase [Legionella sp.]